MSTARAAHTTTPHVRSRSFSERASNLVLSPPDWFSTFSLSGHASTEDKNVFYVPAEPGLVGAVDVEAQRQAVRSGDRTFLQTPERGGNSAACNPERNGGSLAGFNAD